MPRPSPSSLGRTLLRQLRVALAAEADPARARSMQAYMKSVMPFHGVPMPHVRHLLRALIGSVNLGDEAALAETVRALWHGARFREERYAALALLARPAARALQTAQSMPLYEELIHTGAWWDFVDELAAHRVGQVLAAEPKPVRAVLRHWSRGPDLWLRRAAILAQLRHGEATDVSLLFELIEPAVDEPEFFLRKAIGWALRVLARSRPEAVRDWLDAHADRAAGLTSREARKGLAQRAPRRRAPRKPAGSRRGR